LVASKVMPLRGDIVELSTGDKKDDVPMYYIYDGSRWIVMSPSESSLYTDSSSPPASFQVVTEFPIHYWDSNPNYHGSGNDVELYLKPFLSQIIKHLQKNTDMAASTKPYVTWFAYNQTPYIIYISYPSSGDEKMVASHVTQAIESNQYHLSPQPDDDYSQKSMSDNVLFFRFSIQYQIVQGWIKT